MSDQNSSNATTDYRSRTRKIERWSLVPTGVYLALATGILIYLMMVTSDQPNRFFPIKMKEKDSVEQKQKAIDSWRTERMPDNTELLLSEQSLDTPFEVHPELNPTYSGREDLPFKTRLLYLNEALSWQFRKYWQVAGYFRMICITAIIVALLAALRLRVLTGLLLVASAIMALPGFAWIFDGPMPLTFADRTYFLSPALFVPAIASLALAIYRWRLVPVTKELANDWQMFGLGLFLTAVGIGALVALFMFGGRARASIGLVPAFGIYLMCVRGWRIAKYYYRQNKSLSNVSESSEADE